MRLEREKIKRQINEGASLFRKAWKTGAKGRRRKWSITDVIRKSLVRERIVKRHGERDQRR